MRRKFPCMYKGFLILVDLLLIVVCDYAAMDLVVFLGNAAIDRAVYRDMMPIMLVVALVLFQVNGLFSVTRKSYSEVLIGLFMSLFNLYIIMLASSFFLREFSYSRSILLVAVFLQFGSLAIWRYLYWRIDHAFMYPRNLLLLGTPSESERIIKRLALQPHLRDRVKYVCNDWSLGAWQKAAADADVVVACASLDLSVKSNVIAFCHQRNKQVFLAPNFYDLFCSSGDLDKIDDIPFFRPRYLRPTLEQRLLKRLLDIGFSALVLLLLSPLLLLIMAAIKRDSPGPVFYTQVRSGRNEQTFKVYKFRTMFQNAERLSGPVMASENDPRITAVGRFLRATRLDEIPQFINVLLGQMSIVGPRPERPFFVEQFKKELPEYQYRYNVKPGITGMAQVYGKYNTIPADKLIYDLIYIQNCNVLTDIKVILQTFRVLVSKGSTEGVGTGEVRQGLVAERVEAK